MKGILRWLILFIVISIMATTVYGFTNDFHCKEAYYEWTFETMRRDTQESGNRAMDKIFQEEIRKKYEREQLYKLYGR